MRNLKERRPIFIGIFVFLIWALSVAIIGRIDRPIVYLLTGQIPAGMTGEHVFIDEHGFLSMLTDSQQDTVNTPAPNIVINKIVALKHIVTILAFVIIPPMVVLAYGIFIIWLIQAKSNGQ